MKIGYVYMITSPSGKIYVGSSINVKKRWSYYTGLQCKGQIKLFRSFVKYGVDKHVFEIIWKGNIENMLKYECLIGTYYEVLNSKLGLNCNLPKYSDEYKSISEENRIKRSLSQKGVSRGKGRKLSEEHKKKISLSHKNKICSEEHRKNIGLSKKGNSYWLGKTHTQESKDKIRLYNLGKKEKKIIKNKNLK